MEDCTETDLARGVEEADGELLSADRERHRIVVEHRRCIIVREEVLGIRHCKTRFANHAVAQHGAVHVLLAALGHGGRLAWGLHAASFHAATVKPTARRKGDILAT